MPNLTTNYLQLQLPTPIVVASSGLTDSIDKLVELEQYGAGAIVLKSLFEEEIIIEMNESFLDMTSRPYFYPENFDYSEFEFKNDSVRSYLELISEAKSKIDIPIIASVNCISEQKWVYFSKQIQKYGADALEVNLFVPPTNIKNNSFENERIYYNTLKVLKEEISIPVSLKISYHHSSLANMITHLDMNGADGIVLFNRYFSPDIDINNLCLTSANSLSSETDYVNSLRWVGYMSGKVDCSIAATTGIHSSESIIKQILAGADVVQIASILYKNGNEYIDTLLKEIHSWMEKHKFNSIAEFRGLLRHKGDEDTSIYERTQYMKQFRNFVM